MSKFSKSLFIIIWIFFYPRFILVMILILTVKPKYPHFLLFWNLCYINTHFCFYNTDLNQSNTESLTFLFPSFYRHKVVYFYLLTLKKMKELLPFPFLKKKKRRKKKAHAKQKKSQILFFLKKVLCLECSTFWNTCIHNFLIYPVEGNKKRKKTTLH